MKQANLAVLITCHNRREITKSCLDALNSQDIDFDVYLVDDGSSDGTSEMIAKDFSQVNLIQGDGSLFWAGGMRLAFAEAMKHGYKYYLWLNDDTLLMPNIFSYLLNLYHGLVQQGYPNSILVASTKDPVTGNPTYGGAVKSKLWYSNKFEFLAPSQELQECDTLYGNCVLIPSSVAEKVGNIDPVFVHTMGDLDYGLRARKLGCLVWSVPKYVGTCSQNSVKGSWADTKLTVVERLKKALAIKGFPLKAWTVFTKRHSGFFWFFYLPLPYLRAVIGYKSLNASPTFCEDTTIENPPA
ncbi:MAG: glycosyltransferase family 2 protein [Pleurocapsa sp.]